MPKVDTYIRVVMDMDLKEARELHAVLTKADGAFELWQALDTALTQVEGVVAK